MLKLVISWKTHWHSLCFQRRQRGTEACSVVETLLTPCSCAPAAAPPPLEERQAQGWGVSRKWQHQVCGEAWTWVPCESPLQRTEPGPRGLPSLGWIADQRDGSRLEGCAGGRGTGLGEAEEGGLWCLAVPQADGGALYLPQQSPQGCSQQDSTGMRVRWHSAGETAQERRR